jgi:hypothetical protein
LEKWDEEFSSLKGEKSLNVAILSVKILYLKISVVDPDHDPHSSDKLDPDPHQGDKLDPDPDPHQFADDKPKCMKYESI